MREIKFRAWDDDRNEMLYDLDSTCKVVCYNNDENMFVVARDKENGDWNELQVMQYTGQKDKYDDEIYEGDVVKLRWVGNTLEEVEYIGEVKWTKWCYHITKKNRPSIVLDTIILNSRNPEIIGNIYQNPELMVGTGL